MPISALTFRPGVNTQVTATGNEGGWSASTLVRFRDGLPEKFKGWVTFANNVVTGSARTLWSWATVNGLLFVAVGTSTKLYIRDPASAYFLEITPIRRTAVLTNPISTSIGSPYVLVRDTAHGVTVGSVVALSGSAAVGGLPINGTYPVFTVLDADSYIITAASNATSSVSNSGGTVTAAYVLNIGSVDNGAAGVLARTWAIMNWGDYALAVPLMGSLYVWTDALNTPATVVTNTTPANGPPLVIGSMLIGMPERHCILLGCSDLNASTNFDPMLVRFSDVEDFTSYLPTATNSAGSFRFQGGTRLLTGLVASQQILIWSDTALFSMRFIGAPYYYAFDTLAHGCGIIGPRAMIEYNGVVYWMGDNSFYQFTGGAPTELECSVWDQVFPKMNKAQASKVYCGLNSEANEILWFWPGDNGTATENSQYVAYNYSDKVWYYGQPSGQLQRNCWQDRDTFPLPIAIDASGQLYSHETGVDAAGTPMFASIRSGDFSIGDGDRKMYLDRVFPDFEASSLSGSVYLIVHTTDYPMSTYNDFGPYTITSATKFLTIRKRARQMSFEFLTYDLGAWFRFGTFRAAISADGKN